MMEENVYALRKDMREIHASNVKVNLSPYHRLVSRNYFKKSLIMASIFGSKSKSLMTMSIPPQVEPLINRPVFWHDHIMEITKLIVDREQGLIIFTYGIKEVTFKTPYRDSEMDDLTSEGHDLLSSKWNKISSVTVSGTQKVSSSSGNECNIQENKKSVSGTENNRYENKHKHPKQPESVNDTNLDDALNKERDLLASLIENFKCEIDDSNNRNKILESSNKAFKEANKQLGDVNKLMSKDLTKFQIELYRFLALGWHLEEIHVTWAHLEKKRTRLRLYTIYLEELCIQSVETAS
ncbi:hypothetical protein Tco_0597851 [Tanacetum coccineum]